MRIADARMRIADARMRIADARMRIADARMRIADARMRELFWHERRSIETPCTEFGARVRSGQFF